MKAERLYLGLAVIGTILPISAFWPWLVENGLDVRLFYADLFSNPVGAYFGWDVIVAAFALLAFILIEGRRCGIAGLWRPIVACAIFGVSSGLPLFLWMRERHRSRPNLT